MGGGGHLAAPCNPLGGFRNSAIGTLAPAVLTSLFLGAARTWRLFFLLNTKNKNPRLQTSCDGTWVLLTAGLNGAKVLIIPPLTTLTD